MAFKDWFKENSAGIPGFQWVKDRQAQKDAESERKDVAAANERLAQALGLAGQQYAEQRPFRSAASQEALRNQLGLFSAPNEMMREMSGGRYALDLNAPVDRYPSPYNMQLAAQQQAYDAQPRVAKPPAGQPMQAPGWGGVGGNTTRDEATTRALRRSMGMR